MIRVPQISKTLPLRRFIDDIIFIAKNNEISEEIVKHLKGGFQMYGLKITSKIMSIKSRNSTLPFLDVQHIPMIIKEGNKSFFKTKKYIKTAQNSTAQISTENYTTL